MNKADKHRAVILRKAVAMVKLYPASYGTRYWLVKEDVGDVQTYPEILPEALAYPEPYKGISASLAGHIAILIGCPLEPEFSRKMLPKKLHQYFEPKHTFLHLPDLVARFLGGQDKEQFASLFYEDEWADPFKEQLFKASVEDRWKILQKRVNHFINEEKFLHTVIANQPHTNHNEQPIL